MLTLIIIGRLGDGDGISLGDDIIMLKRILSNKQQ